MEAKTCKKTLLGYLETQALQQRVRRLGGAWHAITRNGRWEVGAGMAPGEVGHWGFAPSTREADCLDGQPLTAETDLAELILALRSVDIDAEIAGEGLAAYPRIRNARIETFPGGQCAVAVRPEVEREAREIFAETGLSPRELADQRAELLDALWSIRRLGAACGYVAALGIAQGYAGAAIARATTKGV